MKIKLFGSISKVDQNDDGTLTVSGIASTEAVDSQGEVVTADAMKTALPDYMKFGAIREMHQPSAAGTALKAEVNGDGQTVIEALIVDSEAVKKVLAGVYKGFSIGGKVTARDDLNKTTITGLNLTEISLVDRPANPEAVITMYKGEDIEEPVPAEPVDSPLTKADVAAMIADALAKAAAPADPAPAPAADPVPAAPTEIQKVATSRTIQKGMYQVGDLASILASLYWLQQDTAWEAEYEGDNSPIPARIKQLIADAGAILQDMVAEEVGEMTATPDSITLAAPTEDLAKAAGLNDEITKRDGEIAKLSDDLAKANTLIEDLSKSAADALARIQTLEAMPEAPKAKLHAIGKAEDNGAVAPAPQTADEMRKSGMREDEITAEMIKRAQSQPISLF